MITNPAGTLLFDYRAGVGPGRVPDWKRQGPDRSSRVAVSAPFLPGKHAADGQGKYLYVTEQLGKHIGLEWQLTVSAAADR